MPEQDIFIYEAYLRWPQPLLSSLRAYEVNEALVKANRLFEVEASLLEMLSDDFSRLQSVSSPDDFRLAFNVSASQLIEESFLTRVEKYLRHKNLTLDKLVFELSERALKRVLDHQADFFIEAGKQGFQFALDNFGSDCSPLMNLKRLPLQYIKLSPEFSRDMSDHSVVIRCIVDLCHHLQIPCVAEGVSSQSVSDTWSGLGVHLQQGEFAAPRLPLREFANKGSRC